MPATQDVKVKSLQMLRACPVDSHPLAREELQAFTPLGGEMFIARGTTAPPAPFEGAESFLSI